MAYESGSVAQDEMKRKAELRARGIAAAKAAAGASAAMATDLEGRAAAAQQAFQQAGQSAVRASDAATAEGLAAGTTAATGGGSSYGALLQAGKQAGLNAGTLQGNIAAQAAQQSAEAGKAIGQARVDAAGQELEAIKFEGEAGSATSDRKQKVADYMTQAETAMANSKGFFNDDEDLAADRIEALVKNEEDPEVKKQILDLAARVRSGDYDF